MSLILDTASFDLLYRETIRELFFYQWYLESCNDRTYCTDSAAFFYRSKEIDATLIHRVNKTVNSNYQYSPEQNNSLEKLIGSLDDYGTLKSIFVEYFPYWKLLMPEDHLNLFHGIQSPEEPTAAVVLNDLHKEHGDDFYIVQGYLWSICLSGEMTLIYTLFLELIKIDPKNPFILLRFSRFLASNCYKATNDPALFIKAKKCIYLSIKQLGDQASLFSFCYSWLGQIYAAENNYLKAIELYNVTIEINKNNSFFKEDPNIWKAWALTSLGEYKESADLYKYILSIGVANKHILDFRFHRNMAINFWGLHYINDFRESFLKSVSLIYDTEGSFIISINHNRLTMSDSFYELKTLDPVLFNEFTTFKAYYSSFMISENEQFANIAYLAWMYLKMQLKNYEIIFHNSRGLEKFAFIYLQSFLHE